LVTPCPMCDFQLAMSASTIGGIKVMEMSTLIIECLMLND